jgi:tripartite-type tricarboxylate transporter receptor subunit TctC
MKMLAKCRLGILAALLFAGWSVPALAQSAAAAAVDHPMAGLYRGKTVDVWIGYSAGGGYDAYARLLTRHMGKHIPGNPAMVARNMEGRGSLLLANWLYTSAPDDGLVFGTISRGSAFDPLLGLPGADYDPTQYGWIGSANNEVSVCVAWHTTPVNKFEDALANELVVGGTGGSDDTSQFPKVLNDVLGTKFKLVKGYAGGNEISNAMEKGEVGGRCGWSWSSVKSTRMKWVEQGKIRVLVQLALERHPELPGVPLVTQMASTDEQAQILKLIFARQVIGRPFVAPPGLPPERLELLRQAFAETMRDPDFLADARAEKLEITPVPGEYIDRLVAEVYKTPKEIAVKAGALLR